MSEANAAVTHASRLRLLVVVAQGVAETRARRRAHDTCGSCFSGFFLSASNANSLQKLCKACQSGYFQPTPSSKATCIKKLTSCPQSGLYKFIAGSSTTEDDTWCRPKCAAGQGYAAASVIAKPSVDDRCVTCPLNTFAADAYPHFEPCLKCPPGKYTADEGSRFKTDCSEPKVRTYRSTHRMWYIPASALLDVHTASATRHACHVSTRVHSEAMPCNRTPLGTFSTRPSSQTRSVCGRRSRHGISPTLRAWRPHGSRSSRPCKLVA